MNPEQQTPPQYQPSPDQEPQSQPQPPIEPQVQPQVQQQPSVEPQPQEVAFQPAAPAPETVPFAAPAPAPVSAAEAPAADPGKGLGIAGFILAFVMPIVGLPLSIVGYRKSRKGGFKNSLALAGIILNAVFLVLGILMFLLISMVAYNGISQKAKASAAQPTTDPNASMQLQSQ